MVKYPHSLQSGPIGVIFWSCHISFKSVFPLAVSKGCTHSGCEGSTNPLIAHFLWISFAIWHEKVIRGFWLTASCMLSTGCVSAKQWDWIMQHSNYLSSCARYKTIQIILFRTRAAPVKWNKTSHNISGHCWYGYGERRSLIHLLNYPRFGAGAREA